MKLKLDFKALGIGQLTKVVENLKNANEQFGNLKKTLDDNKKSMSAFADFKIIRFFDAMNTKMFDIVRTQKELALAGGIFGLLSAKFAEFNGVLEAFGATGLLSKMKLITSVLFSWLVPLALIAAGIFLLSRIWKENIGGIQTKWIAFMGRLRNTWARFDIQVRKLLRAMGPLFDVIFTAGFELLHGLFSGFVSTIKVFVGIFGPFLSMLGKFFKFFKTDGRESLKIWEGIGKVLGVILTVFTGFLIISKIIAMIKAMSVAFTAFNVIVSANPIGLVILAVAAVIGGIVLLQKKFDIFGKYMRLAGSIADWWKDKFKNSFEFIINFITRVIAWWKNLFKTIFSFAIEKSPIFKGIKLVQKAIKFFKGESGKEDSVAASSRIADTAARTNNIANNNQDNRSATVTIHTKSMDSTQANNIGDAFINPVLDINKQI